MPKEIEKELKRLAKEKYELKKGSRAFNRYVYGTLRKLGWEPQREKK